MSLLLPSADYLRRCDGKAVDGVDRVDVVHGVDGVAVFDASGCGVCGVFGDEFGSVPAAPVLEYSYGFGLVHPDEIDDVVVGETWAEWRCRGDGAEKVEIAGFGVRALGADAALSQYWRERGYDGVHRGVCSARQRRMRCGCGQGCFHRRVWCRNW